MNPALGAVSLRQVLANLVILTALWQNASSTLKVCNLPPPVRLPVPAYLDNLFYMHGVFLTVQQLNREYVAYGASQEVELLPEAPTSELIDLELKRYFPQHRGEANQRAALVGLRFKPIRRQRMYQHLCRQIRLRHNAAQPSRRVARVVLYVFRWPSDPRGYYYRFGERRVELLASG